jgi:diadenosine tetraphosphatase ApaH/serine/threonine PP2A family protein phosphatase
VKLALLSDIHANLPALEACLAHANAQGANQFALLGDIVDYGPYPTETVERCRQLEKEGAIVLRGNHDSSPASTPTANPVAATWGNMITGWTFNQLSVDQQIWLAQLPLTAIIEKVFLVHATADAPEKWHYIQDERLASRSLDAASKNSDIRYVFGGHVHQQSLYYRGAGQRLMPFEPKNGIAIPVGTHRHWLATVGSVGQPRDGDTRANYALLDTQTSHLTFHRVSYDHLSVAQAMRDLDLPEELIKRLESGR